MNDLIYKQAAIDICANAIDLWHGQLGEGALVAVRDKISGLPSAQPEVKEIGYAECANAMLKMWIDNVLTDGEYNRIMDKLNAHHNAGRRQAESEEV